tara:strand:+ start:103 stop:486 length:384 start_codon:yes stop_codon:yes gene_type:complete
MDDAVRALDDDDSNGMDDAVPASASDDERGGLNDRGLLIASKTTLDTSIPAELDNDFKGKEGEEAKDTVTTTNSDLAARIMGNDDDDTPTDVTTLSQAYQGPSSPQQLPLPLQLQLQQLQLRQLFLQ